MARKKRRKVASRGSVNNIILKTLVNGDKYGYEIIKEVEKYSDGKIILKQPSLYSSLTRFEEKKFVSSYWGDSDIGGRRHYYHLTNEGLEYYKRVVLKEVEDESDENDIELSEQNDTTSSPHEVTIPNIKEDIIFNNNANYDITSNCCNDVNIVMNEINENEIPVIANFKISEEEQPNKIFIPDHQFIASTPIEKMIGDKESKNSVNLSKDFDTNSQCLNDNKIDSSLSTGTNDEDKNSLNYNKEDEAFDDVITNLRTKAKHSKNQLINKLNKLYIRKPKKITKIILDSDGIYKLRDEDYVPTKRRPDIIIDNVIKRHNHSSDVLGYASYSNNLAKNTPSKQIKTNISESEEEKRLRNENFIAKFNLLTMSKIKPVSTPVQKHEVEEKKTIQNIDYRSKLNAILESNNILIDETNVEEEPINSISSNNLYNYIDEDKWNTTQQTTASNNIPLQNNIINENIEDDVDDAFISLEEEETFEIKQINNEYLDNINTYTSPSTAVKMSRYDNITQAVLADRTYLLNNKLKLFFGIIMTIIMLAETTSLLLIFNSIDLIHSKDEVLFIVSYLLIGIFALIYIIPFFINSNSHKANNFKLKYSIWFGFLTFLVGSILIYCFNALSGFELDNFNLFVVKLILPIVLIFNFIIGPLVYSLLLKNKSFYD